MEYDTDSVGQAVENVKAGRLDEMADQAVRDFHEGRCTEL